MRRSLVVVLLVSLASVWVGSVPAVGAPRVVVRSYVGTTATGGTIRLFTKVRDGIVRFQAIGLEDTATCDDGSALTFAHGVDRSPHGVPMDGTSVALQETTFAEAFTLTGTIGTRVASGTITHLFASLDPNEDAQLCSTGELTFTAERELADAPVDASALLVVDGPSGSSLVGLAPPAREDVSAATALRERLRNYEGTTSASMPIFLTTAKTATAVELRELGFSWHLDCEDTISSVDLGFFIFFAGEIVQDERISYGASAPEIALHIDGRLGAHRGAGTTSITMPALTEDLQAQACRSGDLTWTAERVTR